jgi:hypothetical protein
VDAGRQHLERRLHRPHRHRGGGTSLTVVPERFILSATTSASLAKLDIDYQGFGRTNWDGTPFPPNHQFFFTTPPSIRHDLHTFDLRGEVPSWPG